MFNSSINNSILFDSLAPDYESLIDITSNSEFITPCEGYIFAKVNGGYFYVEIIIENVTTPYLACCQGNNAQDSNTVYVARGSKIKPYLSNTSDKALIFIPCKGAQ